MRHAKSMVLRKQESRDTLGDEAPSPQHYMLEPLALELHVTSDAIDSVPNFSRLRPNIPPRRSSHRHTWPQTVQEARIRHTGSYNFDDVPHLTRTPWELQRTRRPPLQSSRNGMAQRRRLPTRHFEQLPRELFECIVYHLKSLHCLSQNVDVVGRNNDLRSLMLTDKRWHRVAREHAYRELWLPGERNLKSSFTRVKPRLQLLLRTLGETPSLAYFVRHLRITNGQSQNLLTRRHRQQYTRLLAEVIYQCPDLEELSGLANAPNVDFEQIHLALLTRNRLKTHVWQTDEHVRLALCTTELPAGHAPWQMLETLVLYQWPTRPDWHGDIGAISATVCRLPQLKHLMISHYSRRCFHNGTLLALPKLQSLRLENLEGLTDQGVEQYVQSAAAWNLLNLSLIDLELLSLHTI